LSFAKIALPAPQCLNTSANDPKPSNCSNVGRSAVIPVASSIHYFCKNAWKESA
jgi:hypothetical protein